MVFFLCCIVAYLKPEDIQLRGSTWKGLALTAVFDLVTFGLGWLAGTL